MSKTLLSIIIPIYNEKNTVIKLLDIVYKHPLKNVEKELILVESNSTDGTRDVVKKFVQNKKNVTLILQKKAEGKGVALREGFKKAKGSIILIQDADLEYDIKDYQKLINPILKGKTDFVLGSRHMNDDQTYTWNIREFDDKFYAYFMNFGGIFFHTLFNIVYQINLTDPTTMYKVFKRKLLDEIHLKGQYFELDWELVAKFIRKGHRPLEIPIKYSSRSVADGKKVRVMRDAPKYMKTILLNRILPLNKL